MLYQGSCHCGAVAFKVEAPDEIVVQDCNCSICAKAGFLHLIVPKARFRLLEGHDAITTYTFNTSVARHTFCRICGIKPFYTPRSNPDGVDVNARCLDTKPVSMTIVPFDGQNWEQSAAARAHLSQQP